jgi:enterochelin esterase family protein
MIMKMVVTLIGVLVLTLGSVVAVNAGELNIRTGLGLTPYHQIQEGIPKGRLEGPFEHHSKILKGTVRRYWVFVPAQYDSTKPANLMVFNDGQRATNPNGSLRVNQVLENLIGKNEIPVTIGVFVTPGNKSKDYPDDLGMSNPNMRAQEYDALNDLYVRMLIEELLPKIGKTYNLTRDPSKRIIGGTSSGAIASFTAAWHRPDYFQNVFSAIGSYVSIGFKPNEKPIKLGGQDYPALIRREAIRPMTIYIQDGENDIDNEWGNWFLANQQMVAALGYANRIADEKKVDGPRYNYRYVWTDGKHNDNDGGALLPEAIKWFWGDSR